GENDLAFHLAVGGERHRSEFAVEFAAYLLRTQRYLDRVVSADADAGLEIERLLLYLADAVSVQLALDEFSRQALAGRRGAPAFERGRGEIIDVLANRVGTERRQLRG